LAQVEVESTYNVLNYWAQRTIPEMK